MLLMSVTGLIQGTMWPANLGVPPFDVRRHISKLHNGKDIVIVPKEDSTYDYEQLMATSVFCAVPRGGERCLMINLNDTKFGNAQVLLM